MQNLTDRDMGYDLLYGCKSTALTYMEAVMESASPRCREIFHRLHDDCLRGQWKVWQFLHQRQEYRTDPAQRQEVEGLHQRMAHLCRTHEIGARQAVGVGAQGQWEPENRGATGYGAGRSADGREGGRWDDREGRWSDAGAGYTGRESAYGLTGSTHGGPTTGTYGATGSSGGITFDPDRSLPEGTRFESDRGFAEGGATSGTTAMGTGGAYGATGSAFGTGGGAGYAGRGTAGRGGVSIGASPSESSRRNFGESTWSSEETRKSGRY